MSWIDLVILAIAALAALRGYRSGALRQIGSFAGFAAGFLLGTGIAASLAADITRARWRPIVVLVLVLVLALAGSFIGHVLGSLASRSLHALRMGLVDRVAGVILGVAGALVMCWLTAGLLSAAAWGGLASGIQNSLFIKALDAALPPVPAIEARVQALVRNADFPSMFSGIVSPTLPFSGLVPHLGPVKSSLAEPASVQKVIAIKGCVNDHEGTGFFVGPHEVVTNAHVVAGATEITVGGRRATVVLFDPRLDLAVLRVPSLAEAPLSLLTQSQPDETPARIVGFPLNGSRTAAPAVIRGELSGSGRDIYNRQIFTRTLIVLNAQVKSGNSGSPVLVRNSVAGVIVSKSLSQSETAYAIPAAQLRADLSRVGVSGSVSTQGCLP